MTEQIFPCSRSKSITLRASIIYVEPMHEVVTTVFINMEETFAFQDRAYLQLHLPVMACISYDCCSLRCRALYRPNARSIEELGNGKVGPTMGVFDWSSSVTYVLTDWTFLTILCSTGTGNEAM